VDVRCLGIDYGARRLGLALSDASGQIARPWCGLAASSSPEATADAVLAFLAGVRDEPVEEIAAVVVGLPRRLNGEDTSQTAYARRFAAALASRLRLPVHLQDERLSSREAESQLAVREPDWRRRKARVDAVAARIILQDYLDSRPHDAPTPAPESA
jgi:putative Holliday junction resolvase